MTVNKILKKAWNIVTTAVVAFVVLSAVFLMGSRLVGFRVFTVISGSMEPTYSVGDLIYVKEVDAEEIKAGDPITFVLNENLVVATHRVVKIDAENQHFYTKGDANDTPDADPVHFNNLIGKPIFAVPYLGYVSDWIQHSPGTYITIAIAVMLILAMFLPDLFKKKEQPVPSPESEAIAKEKAELEKIKAEIAAQKADLETAKSNAGENKPE